MRGSELLLQIENILILPQLGSQVAEHPAAPKERDRVKEGENESIRQGENEKEVKGNEQFQECP